MCFSFQSAFHLGVKGVAQTVTHKVEAQNGEQQADTGRDPDEQVVRHDVGVVDIVDDVAPGGKRVLDAQTQEGQRGFGQDGGAEAHRAGDDQLRDDVGDQMAEDAVPDLDAAGLGGQHELLLAQREDLAADQTGNARPAEEAQDQHQVHHALPGIDAHRVHGRTDDDDDGHRGDAVENIDDTHNNVVDPAAEVAGDAAHQDAEGRFNDNNDEADDQRDTSAVHQAGQHVHTVRVGAEPVLFAGGGVAVINVGLGHLLDAPDLGGGVVDDVILGLVALGVGVIELGGVVVDGLLEAVLEVTGDDDAGIGGGDDEAADIAQCLAAGGDVAVLVQGVVHAVGGELALDHLVRSAHSGAHGISALDHKSADHTVKDQTVIKSFFDQADKIVDRDRCHIRI